MKNHLLDLNHATSELEGKNYSRQIDPLDIQLLMERRWQSINKHVLVPSNEEIQTNPRSRSAKLRAAIRIL